MHYVPRALAKRTSQRMKNGQDVIIQIGSENKPWPMQDTRPRFKQSEGIAGRRNVFNG